MRRLSLTEDTGLPPRMTTGKIVIPMGGGEPFVRSATDLPWSGIAIEAGTVPAEAANISIPPPNGIARPMAESIAVSGPILLGNRREAAIVDLVISNAETTMTIVKRRVRLRQENLPRRYLPLRTVAANTIVAAAGDVEDEVEEDVTTIAIIRLRPYPHSTSRKDVGAAAVAIGTKTVAKILENLPREEGSREEKNADLKVDDAVRIISSILIRDRLGTGMTIMEIETAICAFSVGTITKNVGHVEGILLPWEEVLRTGVDAIVVLCSIIRTLVAVAVILAAVVAVDSVTVSMVLRSAVVVSVAVDVVGTIVVVAAAGVDVGGFPTGTAADFTRIAI